MGQWNDNTNDNMIQEDTDNIGQEVTVRHRGEKGAVV